MSMDSTAVAPGTAILVIGAGLVGLSVALALQRRGMQVTLTDAAEPGSACSFGNGGMIQVGSSLPIAAPGILGKLPRMLLDREGPLSIKWAHVPALLPWAKRFLAYATPQCFAANERTIAGLLAEAKPAYDRLLQGTPVTHVFRERGELYVVRSEEAFAGYAEKIAACRRNGVEVDILDSGAIHDMEPLLAPEYAYGLYLPGSAYVFDLPALAAGILELFRQAGGRFERADIVAREADQQGRIRVRARHGTVFETQRVVVATGAQSGPVSSWFGKSLPIEPLRGYHIMLPDQGAGPAGPVIEGEMNIALTPMQAGIRVAGTLEFAGAHRPPSWHRADMLLPMARRMMPSLADQVETRWYGDRPGTPDSVPIIGAQRDEPRVVYACGHGMLGLTLAARTAELVAAALTEHSSSVQMQAYSPDRFFS